MGHASLYSGPVTRWLPVLLFLPAACAAPALRVPSLAPRAGEAIDPRLPVPDRSGEVPADQGLREQAEALVRRALSGSDRFNAAISSAERLAGVAGPAGSESWTSAQQALSAAIAERYPVTRTLGDLDALTQARIQARGGLSPADVAVLREAAARVAELDRAQAARVEAVQARLRG